MKRALLALVASLAVPLTLFATETQDRCPPLLDRMRKALDALRTTPDSTLGDRVDLSSLIGVTRKEIDDRLGRPDYCRPRGDCDSATEWAYFFFYREPNLVGGGCCALVLLFSERSAVKSANWEYQR